MTLSDEKFGDTTYLAGLVAIAIFGTIVLFASGYVVEGLLGVLLTSFLVLLLFLSVRARRRT